MTKPLRIDIADSEELEAFLRLTPEPQAHMELDNAEVLLARCGDEIRAGLSVRTASDVVGVAGIAGLIGHYHAASSRAGVALLHHAVTLLAGRGCSRVLGPMNGSTWGRYRLVLHGGDDGDPFFTEPWNPPEYPEHFRRAGFVPVARYESRIVETASALRAGADELAGRVSKSGVNIAPLDPGRLAEELEALFPLCAAAFAENPFYRPIERGAFVARFSALRAVIDPELIRIARRPDGRVEAFVLALPDHLASQAGRPPRVILKTLASAPSARGRGLGAHLADEIHRLAHTKGYVAVIHALMHNENASMRLSGRFGGREFRHYALFGLACVPR